MKAVCGLRELHISKYPKASSLTGQKVLLVGELMNIKSGYYKSIIKLCRDAYQKSIHEYKKLKSNLPALAFSGVFDGAHRADSLIEYNNLLIVDIDHVPVDQLLGLKTKLFNDKHVFACWISPSGNGLKALVRVNSNATMHKFTFDRVVDHLFATYDVEIDLSGSDVCRLCFISHDDDLLFKEIVEPFPVDDEEWLIELVAREKNTLIAKISDPVEKKKQMYSLSEKVLFFKTEGRNKRDQREMVKKIIAFLKRTKQSITGNYPNWLKVGMAISNAFTYELGHKIFLELCRLDGPFHDEYKSDCLLEYCYRKRKVQEVNFGTIVFLAQEKGFVVNYIKKQQVKGLGEQSISVN